MTVAPIQFPEFDTPDWRESRHQKLVGWVGNDAAVAFIELFGDVCEVWDDLIDRDKKIQDADIHRAFWQCLIDIPANPFFDAYKGQLIPLLVVGINAWLDANDLEKGSKNDQVFAYVLRDWYVEFVSYVILLTRGHDYLRANSLEIRRFFTHHETLDEYLEKLT